MKKLLSLLLTICLLIAVTVIPVPAMAATGEILFDFGVYGTTGSPVSHTIGATIDYPELPSHPNGLLVWSLYTDVYEEPPTILEYEYLQVYVVLLEGVFNFESYSPNRYIGMSGRVVPVEEADGNTVIKFDNNGIPYRTSDIDASRTYTKSGSDYTQVTEPDSSKYAEYYHVSATTKDFTSTTKNTVTYNATTGIKSISFNSFEAYNAIELGELEASKTYKITINYKRESLVNALYVQPVTWDQEANWRYTMYVDDNYKRITIPTGSGDSDWQTVSTYVTTPADLVDATGNNTGTDASKPSENGNVLRLVLFTGFANANNVVYFDNITVEEVVVAKITYHNADGTTKEDNIESGSTIDYPDLAPNKLGENGGVWYADAQGTTPSPTVMPAANLDVYEVVKTGVFDFNNYYRFQGYTGNNYGINSPEVVNSIYADGSGNIIVDTTKYTEATNKSVAALRRFLIAIGEAEISTNYKITVEYSYTANNPDQRLILTPLTCYGTLTNSGITGGEGARAYGTSVELPQGDNQSIDLFFTSADEFLVNVDTSGRAEYEEVANSFYLNVKTKEDGLQDKNNEVLATISKVTVVECVAPAQTFTVTLNRGGVTEEVQVEKGKEFTLPDTKFTDTSWWNNATASSASRFVGYEGDKVTVNADVTYYTAENYAKGDGASMYRNWTVVEDATEGLTYLRKTMVDTDTATAWDYSNGTRLCTRLGVVEDGNTYKISITYKAETDTPLDFVMAISAVGNPGDSMRSYLEETKKYLTVSEDTNGWTTATFYITADPPAQVTANNNGLDDTKNISGFEGLYLMVNKAAGAHNVDISIKETKVVDLGKVVEAKGASVLTDKAAAEAGKQAIRYYFDYKTAGDGTTITIDGTDYTVVERGFLYTNGDITHYATEGVEGTSSKDNVGKHFVCGWGNIQYGIKSGFMMWLGKAKVASGNNLLTYRSVSGEALLKKWNLENNTLTFSTYITNIAKPAYDAKFMVRGYVIFEDENGVEHTIYSKTTNRSVNGIKNALG